MYMLPNITKINSPTHNSNLQISVTSTSERDEEEQIKYDQSNQPFKHSFTITNKGPSPQNKPVTVTAYVPNTDMVALTCKFLSPYVQMLLYVSDFDIPVC